MFGDDYLDSLVSVVIPTFARPYMLGRAIESVLAQQYREFEILVIDDNGNGSENQIITEEYMQKYQDKKCIRYLKHETNLGGCAARNTGIRNAKGCFIGFLDDDDEWAKDFLLKLMNKFCSNAVGAIYCKNLIEKKGKIFYSEKGEPALYKGQVFKNLLGGWCPASTSLFIVRKECFEKVGGFDESLKSFQDYDMWLRVAQEYDFDYVDERLVIKHEEHGGEQVGFNPYNRQLAMTKLKEKWDELLSKNEKLLFNIFLEQHSMEIKRNLIIYNKQKGIRCNYIKLYKNYLLSRTKLYDKILILLTCIFGVKVLIFKDQVVCKLLRRYKFIKSYNN